MVAAAKGPATPKKTGAKFKGDCQLCGVKGHKAADRFSNEKNKDKRPPWWKESANVTTSEQRKCSFWSILLMVLYFWGKSRRFYLQYSNTYPYNLFILIRIYRYCIKYPVPEVHILVERSFFAPVELLRCVPDLYQAFFKGANLFEWDV